MMVEITAAVTTLLGTLTDGVTVTNIASLLSIVLGAAFAFIMFWFAIRKLFRIFMGALRKGRLSV